jgi:hypothetical protein
MVADVLPEVVAAGFPRGVCPRCGRPLPDGYQYHERGVLSCDDARAREERESWRDS